MTFWSIVQHWHPSVMVTVSDENKLYEPCLHVGVHFKNCFFFGDSLGSNENPVHLHTWVVRFLLVNGVKIAWQAGAKRRVNRPAARDVSTRMTHKLRPSTNDCFCALCIFTFFSQGSVLQESPPYFHPIRLQIIRPVGAREDRTVEKRDKERAGVLSQPTHTTHTHTQKS